MMLAAVGFSAVDCLREHRESSTGSFRARAQKEIALRAALGAAPKPYRGGSFLQKNVVLGLAGGVCWSVSGLLGGLVDRCPWPPPKMPRLDQSSIDASTLAFACVVAPSLQLFVWIGSRSSLRLHTLKRSLQIRDWHFRGHSRSSSQSSGGWRSFTCPDFDGRGPDFLSAARFSCRM